MLDAACSECTLGTRPIVQKSEDHGYRRVDIAPSPAPEREMLSDGFNLLFLRQLSKWANPVDSLFNYVSDWDHDYADNADYRMLASL